MAFDHKPFSERFWNASVSSVPLLTQVSGAAGPAASVCSINEVGQMRSHWSVPARWVPPGTVPILGWPFMR